NVLYGELVRFYNDSTNKNVTDDIYKLSPNKQTADISAKCDKIGQSTFCVTSGSSTSGRFGGLCGGILGDTLPVNLTNGTCLRANEVEAMARNLAYGPTTGSDFT
ncbi:22615_t:CDS:2, partial [Racocetra persica]